MSTAQTLVLGAVAGVTIFLGLPVARYRNAGVRTRVFLTALAAGILLFLFVEVLEHAWQPVEEGAEESAWGEMAGFGLLFVGGTVAGLMSLIYYDRWMNKQRGKALLGPGAASAAEFERPWTARLTAGEWLALLIAVGIGLHNFGEGLAIGGSAAAGEIGLATILVIGFALHNGTEGFGIVAPLAAEDNRPSWGFLLLMGLIGGGPTMLGTAIGRQFTSDAMSVIFLTLAAGSILYVVIQLLGVAHKIARKDLLYWGVLLGLAAGFVTDMMMTAGGA